MDELNALTAAGLEQLGIADNGGLTRRLGRYREELDLWNPRLGLVAASGRDLVVRHILDCLAALPLLRSYGAGPSVADVGSGAGLPGLVLACAAPLWDVTLIERSSKKCGFLRNAVLSLGLANVRVHEADMTMLSEHFDAVLFRAFRPLSRELVALIGKLLRDGGAAYAYKGKRSTVDDEVARIAGMASVMVRGLTVPFLDEERHVVRLSEIKPA